MQPCSLDVVFVGDEAPSTGHTIVMASGRYILERSRPNNVHQKRNAPKRDVCQVEKEMAVKDVPAKQHGDEDNGSGHSCSKANRGKRMNCDDRVPRFPSSMALKHEARAGSPYSASDVSEGNEGSLHPTNLPVLNPSQMHPP